MNVFNIAYKEIKSWIKHVKFYYKCYFSRYKKQVVIE